MGSKSRPKNKSVFIKRLTEKDEKGKQKWVKDFVEVRTKGAFGKPKYLRKKKEDNYKLL